eukprot:7237780-Prymnesium_polylepis.1
MRARGAGTVAGWLLWASGSGGRLPCTYAVQRVLRLSCDRLFYGRGAGSEMGPEQRAVSEFGCVTIELGGPDRRAHDLGEFDGCGRLREHRAVR